MINNLIKVKKNRGIFIKIDKKYDFNDKINKIR